MSHAKDLRVYCGHDRLVVAFFARIEG